MTWHMRIRPLHHDKSRPYYDATASRSKSSRASRRRCATDPALHDRPDLASRRVAHAPIAAVTDRRFLAVRSSCRPSFFVVDAPSHTPPHVALSRVVVSCFFSPLTSRADLIAALYIGMTRTTCSSSSTCAPSSRSCSTSHSARAGARTRSRAAGPTGCPSRSGSRTASASRSRAPSSAPTATRCACCVLRVRGVVERHTSSERTPSSDRRRRGGG